MNPNYRIGVNDTHSQASGDAASVAIVGTKHEVIKNRQKQIITVQEAPKTEDDWKLLADTLLTLRGDGRYQKKKYGYRASPVYYGKDPEAAVREYLRTRSDYEARREPRPQAAVEGTYTVANIFNLYLKHRWKDVERKRKLKAAGVDGAVEDDDGKPGSGKRFRTRKLIDASTWEQYKRAFAAFMEKVPGYLNAGGLGPRHFEEALTHFEEKWGPGKVALAVKMAKCAFQWAGKHEHLDKVPAMGDFDPPPKSEFRRARMAREEESGEKQFSDEEIALILSKAEPMLRAMILLALNCGFQNIDIARIKIGDINWAEGLHNDMRDKTQVYRRGALWPETLQALKVALAMRPTPRSKEYADHIFLTENGIPLVHEKETPRPDGTVKVTRSDALNQRFTRLLRKLKIKRKYVNFSAIRPTFRTAADEANDNHASRLIMGQSFEGIDEVYIKKISVPRIKRVASKVRETFKIEERVAQHPMLDEIGALELAGRRTQPVPPKGLLPPAE